MYSSLHKIDIVATMPDGVTRSVQTDHREPSEVEATPALSTIFALTRMLVPKRAKPEAAVRYTCMGAAHPLLAKVVVACGGELEAELSLVDLAGVAKEDPADLAEGAFAELGREVLGRHALPPNEQGLRALVETMAGAAPAPEEDEIGYYTAVVELAAATGEVLRALHGGRWVADPTGFADVPFLFRLGATESSMNAVGKAIKYFRFGEGESPVYLLRAAEDAPEAAGPLLFALKPSNWDIADKMVCEPLTADLEKAGADIPLVVYGHDRPNTFALMKRDESTPDLATLRAKALEALREQHVEIQTVRLDTITFHVVHGSYFAGEKILDEDFMKTLHARFDTELLAATVPEKGRLLVTTALAPMEHMAAFMTIAQGSFTKNEGGRQISPTVFLVSEGKIVGVAKAGGDEPPPEKKKGFFARLFDWN